MHAKTASSLAAPLQPAQGHPAHHRLDCCRRPPRLQHISHLPVFGAPVPTMQAVTLLEAAAWGPRLQQLADLQAAHASAAAALPPLQALCAEALSQRSPGAAGFGVAHKSFGGVMQSKRGIACPSQ